LRSHDIRVLDLNALSSIPVYIDGADEITYDGAMIKGGGGALTREKIIASAARQFICIADESKLVRVLGAFPLPVEVIPMAHALIARKLAALGGQPELRMKENQPYRTDNGNFILDVRQMRISDPAALEDEINNMPGVVTVGLFAKRGANICLLGTAGGVRTMEF
jgi:ribose 5-phosphate isomerase A